MASVIQINETTFRAQVRRAGHPKMTRTFTAVDSTKKAVAEAERRANTWGQQIEDEIDLGKKVGIRGKVGVTIADGVDRYLKENLNLSVSTVYIFGYLRDGLGKIAIKNLTAMDIVDYIKRKDFSKVSGASHFSFLRTMLLTAKAGWDWHVPDVLNEARDRLTVLKLIGKSNERNRRPTSEELKLLLDKDYGVLPMADIITFAISSAMRQAEICRIEFETFDEEHETILITDRKHPTKKKGNDQVVPLLDESIANIKRQKTKRMSGKVFPYTPNYIGQTFTKACKELGIKNLHFHDLRHEGASRLFEMGYQIHEVAMFTGHEDWAQLKRYTQLKAKNVRRLGGSDAPSTTTQTAGPNPHNGGASVPFEMDAKTMEQFKQFQAMMAMMKQTATV